MVKWNTGGYGSRKYPEAKLHDPSREKRRRTAALAQTATVASTFSSSPTRLLLLCGRTALKLRHEQSPSPRGQRSAQATPLTHEEERPGNHQSRSHPQIRKIGNQFHGLGWRGQTSRENISGLDLRASESRAARFNTSRAGVFFSGPSISVHSWLC